MNKIFGANWRTSLSGLIGVASGVVYTQPELLAFLPPSWSTNVKGVAGFVAAVSASWFAIQAKDKNVTGGTTQQTADGAVALPASQNRSASVTDTKNA